MALAQHADFAVVAAKAVTSVTNQSLAGTPNITVGELLIGDCFVLAGTPSITDSLGNTYTRVGTTSIFTCVAAFGGTGVTVTWHSTSSTAITGGVVGYTGADSAGVVISTATGTSASPTVTSGSIPIGDAVIGFSDSTGPSTDFSANDTTNNTGGSWVSGGAQGTTGGSTTSNVLIITAWKTPVTVAGTQTYNPSLGANSRAWTAHLIRVPALAATASFEGWGSPI